LPRFICHIVVDASAISLDLLVTAHSDFFGSTFPIHYATFTGL